VPDPAGPASHETGGGHASAGVIVRNRADFTVFGLTTLEQDHWHPHGATARGQIRGERDRCQDEAIDLIIEDLIDDGARVARLRASHEHQDVISLFLKRPRERLEDLRVKVIVEIADNEAYHPALACQK